MSAAAGSLSYLLIAVQRFVVIVMNKPHLTLLQMKWLPLLLFVVWCCAAAVTAPFWVYGEPYALLWPDYCIMYSEFLLLYLEIIPACIVYIPGVIILSLYIAIYVFVHKSSARVQTQGNQKKNIHMAVILFLMFFLFIVAYVPYTIFCLFQTRLSLETRKPFLLSSLFAVTIVAAINPIIYALIFKEIKHVYVSQFGTCRNNKVINVTEATSSG